MNQVTIIINADDLGHSNGANRGIEEAHRNGIVTSASLMVNRDATPEGVAIALRNPRLSVGLHVNVTHEDWESVNLEDTAMVARELQAQYNRFIELLNRPPTHLDSHHHIHWKGPHTETFKAFALEKNLPLRHYSQAKYEGSFYGQWEHGVTELSPVQIDYFCELMETLAPGLYEVACHPGYVLPDLNSMYSVEREQEVQTLTDPAARACLERLSIRLISFNDYAELKVLGSSAGP